jgi:5-methylcytosine-specific restriction endonuclease McrA
MRSPVVACVQSQPGMSGLALVVSARRKRSGPSPEKRGRAETHEVTHERTAMDRPRSLPRPRGPAPRPAHRSANASPPSSVTCPSRQVTMPRGTHGRIGGRAWRADRDRCIRGPETHCWLCRTHVDKTLPGTHAWGPTADHEIPLLLGGPELVKDGAVLHLAHNRCNAARSNRLRAQLNTAGPTATPRRPQRELAMQPRTSRQW